MGLQIEFLLYPVSFSLIPPRSLLEMIPSAFYLVFFLWVLARRRTDFRRMTRRAWGWFILGCLLLLPANGLLNLCRTGEGGLPLFLVAGPSYSSPVLPLPALWIVSAIGVWIGPAPGLVAGLLAGLVRAWFGPVALNEMFAFAAWGLTFGFCCRQPYKEKFFTALRHPLVASVAAAVSALTFASLTHLIEALPSGGLVALDYARVSLERDWSVWLAAAALQGVGFALLYHFAPQLRFSQQPTVVSAFSQSLRARFMIVLIPVLLLGVFFSILAVNRRAMTLAREQALAEMARSAATAGDGIAHFYYTGANLLEQFAANPELLEPHLPTRVAALENSRRVIPFFQEMLLTDAGGTVSAAVPEDLAYLDLTQEEQQLVAQALSYDMSGVTHLTLFSSVEQVGKAAVYRLTFVQPLLDGEELPSQGVLLARVQLDVNPDMKRALETLQFGRNQESGFIVDDRGVIIAHQDPAARLRPWSVNIGAVSYPTAVGRAYDDVTPEGERVLVYSQAVEGVPATVVLQLPFAVVLETATAISNPLLLVQMAIGVTLLLVVPLLATRITQPLHALADGARQIAGGNLEVPMHLSGEDEVAQLGHAFEQMRLRLRDRLDDLSLLLNVSQSVSATLDLDTGVPLILEGALKETGAAVARFVLLDSNDRPQRVFSVGLADASLPALDRAFASVLGRRQEPLVSQNLRQEESTVTTAGPLQSVAAFPVRSQNHTVAILWVGAVGAEEFDEARINLLTTLVGQAAVLVENARLFQAAEGGRQRLAAILASTTDAVLVTDSLYRLLLINPATQRLLGLDEAAYGRPVEELNLPPLLADALSCPYDDQLAPFTIEIPFPDVRTYYASIAPIMSLASPKAGGHALPAQLDAEGQVVGRVVVLRDVTYFKELDEMKSEFVATVSHDLRAPLTFIRGYTTMLTMVGDLNEKQNDYLDRILDGITQMSALIDDLLNLGRIEAGLGIRQESCRLGLILVEAVDTMRARAVTKGITLRLEPSQGAPMIIGDHTLLRQAVGNLVDNALKYTPVGGAVNVRLEVNEQDHEAVIHIVDTGIGIAPEDRLRLFEKFYRIKRRETSEISGTGLGLALVRSIVTRHGGRVWVESEPNVGSTFYVALPLAPEPDQEIEN